MTLRGEIASVRTVGVEHDTILAFLSSSCEGCAGFWDELGEPGSWATPLGSRLLVVTKGPQEESPSVLSQLCPDGVDLVMSSQAWADFEVPGSPYVVVADGRTGRVKGEGSGSSFSQVGGLIRQSVEDSRHPSMARKPDRTAGASVTSTRCCCGQASGRRMPACTARLTVPPMTTPPTALG